MLFFPQLSTGACTLYPVARESEFRTLVNVSEGGHRFAAADLGAQRRAWDLRASGLTGDERDAIDALFVATEGALQPFTLLDPSSNLLVRSEEFADAAWTSGALLQFTGGQPDPFGTTRATRIVNPTGATQTVVQTIQAPGNFEYSFSVWAKAPGPAQFTQRAAAGAALAQIVNAITPTWRRFAVTIALADNAESIAFGFEIPAGATVDLFGAQVEAQIGASDYKRTFAEGGVVFPARFASDELTFRAQGTDVFDAHIGIVAVGT